MKIRDLPDPRAAMEALLGHPYRVAIIAALEQRESASPKDLAEHLGVPVEKLSYHVRVLRDVDIIELVEPDPAESGGRRMYRLTQKPRIGENQWASLPFFAREVIAGHSLDYLWRVTTAAAATGCINRPEALVSRWSIRVDEQGFEELSSMLNEVLARTQEIQEAARRRLDEDATEELSATVVTMLFETPDPAAVLALDREPERRPGYRRGGSRAAQE